MKIIKQHESYEFLNGVYKEIAEEFGLEFAIRFHEMYKGLQFNFPMRLYSKDYVSNQLKIEYNGKNARELSKKYSYSERWIRIIIKNCFLPEEVQDQE